MEPRGAKQFLPALAVVPSLCLLVEADSGLVLIETGIGTLDAEDPGRLGFSNHLLNARSDADLPAVRQIARLGLDPAHVRHIVCTHLDRDHAGGLADFPEAEVHVLGIERDAALKPSGHRERDRYRVCHFSHGVKWVAREPVSEEPWYGLECVRDLAGLPSGIVMVPLPGHTRGHCGVAVQTDGGWLLHCGDAFYVKDELKGTNNSGYGVRAFRRLAHMNHYKALQQLDRINSAVDVSDGKVDLVCSHDVGGLSRV
jgi:glyoxylase-like metal-dependent hydrolase (beta-lactamase superfamily II)